MESLKEPGWVHHPPAHPTTLTETTLDANFEILVQF